MSANRIRWIGTSDYENHLGVVQVKRDLVREYVPGRASAWRLGRACEALVGHEHCALVPDPINPLAWFLVLFGEDTRRESCPF